MSLCSIDGDTLRLNFHPGQLRAWDSTKRFVSVLAGTQSGKTSWGPFWLWREIQRRGPGDYLVVTPSYPMLELKCLPEFMRLFKDTLALGEYRGSPTRKFTVSSAGAQRLFGYVPATPTCVFFGYAASPDSLESATAKAAWLDEAGQLKFKIGSWEAINRRLAIHQGRALVTTTPYSIQGWLKSKLFDPWEQAGGHHPDIDVIRFDSTENPAFPPEEFERARRELPPWKFDLFYRAIFGRPAGWIYSCYDAALHTCPRFRVAETWKRYLGLDFGGVNTAGLFFAEEPVTRKLFGYREYHAGDRSVAEHTLAMLDEEPTIPFAVGGSKSEGQWRTEFIAAGLPVLEPAVSEVEVGIDRVFGALKRGEVIFFNDLTRTLTQIQAYSRVLDETGEPTEAIDEKSTYHHLDALRYIIGKIRPGSRLPHQASTGPARSVAASAPAGVFGRGRNPYAPRHL